MSSTNETSNPFATDTTGAQASSYKAIGVSLAVASGVFIGSSFVFKKKGLLQSIEKSGGVAGEGYSYLKSAMWWTGMILMILGELCNFIAYAFTQAILVTPLGALSVVISAVLSSLFLKERLSFQGKVGCFQCIIGAVMIVLHAPEEGADDTSVEGFKHLVISVGFLVYAGIAVVASLVLVFFCGPRWGKKNMLVYICVCSLIGSISVVFTQGLGSAIVHSITIENQFKNWFIYLVLVVTVATLLIEIVYLNKALNLFNTALVTPTYYVIFTTLTIVSSTVLYKGFEASPVDIVTCVLGFLSICSGVALLHNSNSQPLPTVESSKYDDDDEKILVETPSLRKKSIMQMFEKHDDSDGDGAVNPGAADLFPAPFSGISRYASTTKRSQTIMTRRRMNSVRRNSDLLSHKNNESQSKYHSNTISIGNTGVSEDGYSREMQWRDYPTKDITTSPTSDSQSFAMNAFDRPIDEEEHESSIFQKNQATSSHRAQNELDPLTSYRMQLHDDDFEDQQRLV